LEKIAVVSVETYSAKLIIAGSGKQETFSILETDVEPINLALDGEDHFLKKPQIDDTIRTLKNFRKICEMYGTYKTIAVANFIQDIKPKNLYSFFDEVFATCGFRFVVLSDDERNSKLYDSIINTYDIPKGVVANISAYQVDLVEYNRRSIMSSANLDFGPASLISMYPIPELGAATAFAKMEKYVETRLGDVAWLPKVDEEFAFVGCGRYFTDLSKMVRKLKKYPLDRDDCMVVSCEDTQKIYSQLKTMDLSPSKKLKGIEEPRVDMFVASLAIILGMFSAISRQSVTVASRGILEGLILDEFVPTIADRPITDVLGFGIANNTVWMDETELKHSDQVFNLSMLLFKQLRVLHKLPRTYVKVLRIASALHDSGKKINPQEHAKYSYYTILGSDIFGAEHKELVMAGFVASTHAGADINLAEWVKYKDMLTEDDLDAVKKLGVMLSIAERLDRMKNGVVVDINCDILGDSVIMKTVDTGDADYQICKALELCKDFEKNFHKKLEIL
jgi:exopolyphosphatase/guanosine-5'-triphosphate,3'-diphosphate pyrophosphatase